MMITTVLTLIMIMVSWMAYLTARPTLMGPWVVMEIPRPFRQCCVRLRRLLLGFL
jgi:hypothetical protein